MDNGITYGYITACQVCGFTPLSTILSLGHQAPVHAHLTKDKLHQAETLYPLNLCRCNKCGLMQLDYIVDPKIIFYPEYPYFSGMTNMLINDFRALRDTLITNHGLKYGDLIVDIGSNDGTLLKGFKEKGMRVLGVEPTNVGKVAIANGIPTIQEFFNQATAEKIVGQYGFAKAITATNMFAHVDKAIELATGIANILADDGIFVSESQYLADMIKKTALDTIYHEHLRYYSLKPLQILIESAKMSIVDAEHIEAAGGSIRVYAKKGIHQLSERAKRILDEEEKMGILDGRAFENFEKKISRAKQNLLTLILDCKKSGSRIVGIGAPGRSNTLLGYMHIDNTILDYAVEKRGSPKIGLFTPGTHIPIVGEEILFTDQPEYGLLLSWHIADELTAKLRARGYHGKFIVPLPEAKILDI